MDILTFLQDRVKQLGSRVKSIKFYTANGNDFAGSKYTPNDIPQLKTDIEETNTAINAIKLYRKMKVK